MFLDDYYAEDGTLRVSRQQASDFAKKIAGDFNPIHDTDAKRFCVPGDLLFALILNKYGLSQQMSFTFQGMVGDGVQLIFPEPESDTYAITINDSTGKEYLSVERTGDISMDQEMISDLSCRYVEFSGQTFPHILVPLMAENKIMLNPERPMVIYESMLINISRLDIKDPRLELTHSTFSGDGKRGNVSLEFSIISAGEVVGTGKKNLILSGLRDFEQKNIDQLVESYSQRKLAYSA
ncbi:MAG: DUF3581 domain-containing protein [Gammaproteobacteria bacterium]|nr:DUF3581 domain-containing protein [Gammaproteobacteria bacterium]